jgi:hypothetical protein
MYYLTALSTIAYGRSIVLVEETGVPGENHRPVTDKLYHISRIEYTSP